MYFTSNNGCNTSGSSTPCTVSACMALQPVNTTDETSGKHTTTTTTESTTNLTSTRTSIQLSTSPTPDDGGMDTKSPYVIKSRNKNNGTNKDYPSIPLPTSSLGFPPYTKHHTPYTISSSLLTPSVGPTNLSNGSLNIPNNPSKTYLNVS